MSDSYRLIVTRFRGISASGNAIAVDKPQTHGSGECWIPRSLIHGADDVKLAGTKPGSEISIRIFDWKAEELGFA